MRYMSKQIIGIDKPISKPQIYSTINIKEYVKLPPKKRVLNWWNWKL